MKVRMVASGIGFWVILYITIAFAVFQYRNPKSNDMSLFRHPLGVLTFKVMEEYQ